MFMNNVKDLYLLTYKYIKYNNALNLLILIRE